MKEEGTKYPEICKFYMVRRIRNHFPEKALGNFQVDWEYGMIPPCIGQSTYRAVWEEEWQVQVCD
jgi:hypothetical protein